MNTVFKELYPLSELLQYNGAIFIKNTPYLLRETQITDKEIFKKTISDLILHAINLAIEFYRTLKEESLKSLINICGALAGTFNFISPSRNISQQFPRSDINIYMILLDIIENLMLSHDMLLDVIKNYNTSTIIEKLSFCVELGYLLAHHSCMDTASFKLSLQQQASILWKDDHNTTKVGEEQCQ
jgi:hypothetical protein